MTTITTTTLPAFTLTGRHMLTTPMSPEIGQLWGRFEDDIPQLTARTEPETTYGGMRNFNPVLQTFEYLAGVAVPDTWQTLPEHTVWHIPASTYAMSSATIATIGHVMDAIHRWIAQSDFTHGEAPSFERYTSEFHGGMHDPIDILVAIKPRTADTPSA